VAAVCAAGGAALAGQGWLTRYLIPLSGGLLIGVAAGVLMPELAADLGWPLTLGLAALGYGLLIAVDRLAFPICPSCDHAGDNTVHGVRQLESFAAPLLIAVAIHAFVDGWGLVAVGKAAPEASRPLTMAILLHKMPEGLTLGAVTRASFATAGQALVWCVAAEMATIAGGGAGLWLTPVRWVSYPLAMAAGTFLFLGGGALRTWWRNDLR
jgi:zinc transporter ZupT